jgi:hypothetical protein
LAISAAARRILEGHGPYFGRLDTETRVSAMRWARAVLDQRVGVALGGSGAFGYRNVALLEALEARGVPVDFVSGCSSGALIGAYLCVLGAAGLSRVVERGPAFAQAVPLLPFSTRPIEWALDADLHGARLEALDRPLLPVATDIARGRPVVLTRGTVAFGVRASAAAPGLFAPTWPTTPDRAPILPPVTIPPPPTPCRSPCTCSQMTAPAGRHRPSSWTGPTGPCTGMGPRVRAIRSPGRSRPSTIGASW